MFSKVAKVAPCKEKACEKKGKWNVKVEVDVKVCLNEVRENWTVG